METDTHIEVVHCYDCSRHTGMNFYNYESPCQMMVNLMLDNAHNASAYKFNNSAPSRTHNAHIQQNLSIRGRVILWVPLSH